MIIIPTEKIRTLRCKQRRKRGREISFPSFFLFFSWRSSDGGDLDQWKWARSRTHARKKARAQRSLSRPPNGESRRQAPVADFFPHDQRASMEREKSCSHGDFSSERQLIPCCWTERPSEITTLRTRKRKYRKYSSILKGVHEKKRLRQFFDPKKREVYKTAFRPGKR